MKLARDVISQLQIVGGLEHWEIFVAMHIPDSTQDEISTFDRGPLVKELLSRHAHVFSEEREKLDFLIDLNIPPVWISEAFALWAKYKGAKEGRACSDVACAKH